MPKIQPQGLFNTPADFSQIEKWIEMHPVEDRIHLFTAAGMTWNLLAKAINEMSDKHVKDMNAALAELKKTAMLDGEAAEALAKLEKTINQ